MPVIEDHAPSKLGIMPDHACDRGAARLDPGASRPQAYQVMSGRWRRPCLAERARTVEREKRRAYMATSRESYTPETCPRCGGPNDGSRHNGTCRGLPASCPAGCLTGPSRTGIGRAWTGRAPAAHQTRGVGRLTVVALWECRSCLPIAIAASAIRMRRVIRAAGISRRSRPLPARPRGSSSLQRSAQRPLGRSPRTPVRSCRHRPRRRLRC